MAGLYPGPDVTFINDLNDSTILIADVNGNVEEMLLFANDNLQMSSTQIVVANM